MKSKIIAVTAVVESSILLVLAAIWGLDRSLDSLSMCGGKIYTSAPSPDKTLVAYAFERDCGATTDFASFVILRYGDEKLDLAADLKRNEIVFQTDGDYQPTSKWVARKTLQVSFDKNAPVVAL